MNFIEENNLARNLYSMPKEAYTDTIYHKLKNVNEETRQKILVLGFCFLIKLN